MGKLKALIGIALLAGMVYFFWNWIPVKMNNANFQDALDDIARRASYTALSDDDIKSIVIIKAKSMDIPLKENQITVFHETSGLGITVRYHVHLDLLVHPYDEDFTASSMNKRI
jgi:hypothetical protein